MWQLKNPNPVKIIVGILAAENNCLQNAIEMLQNQLGPVDMQSDIWPFEQTDYYRRQTGNNILRQFVSLQNLIEPGRLAEIKIQTNKMEQQLAQRLNLDLPRPVNLDPGIIEPSKLILATTKNYSHRIYIGNKIYAEVTLIYDRKKWRPFEYTYPDYRRTDYFRFFDKVRSRLLKQLKS